MGVIDELRRRSPHALGDLSPAEEQAIACFDDLFGPPAWATPLATLVGDLNDEGRRAFGLWVQLCLRLQEEAGQEPDERLLEAVRYVADANPEWTLREVWLLWMVAMGTRGRRDTDCRLRYRIPLAATARLGPAERRFVADTIASLAQTSLTQWGTTADQVNALVTEPEENDPAARVRNVVWACDPFACLLADEFGTRLGAEPMVPLLRHWATATSARPTKKWLDTARRLLVPEAPELMREILTRLTEHRERPVRTPRDHEEAIFLHRRTTTVLRGLVWTCALVDEPWVTPLLGDVAVTCGAGESGKPRCETLVNAAVSTLVRRGGLDVVAALAKVTVKVRRRRLLAQVGQALGEIAVQAGLTRDQLLDRTVPDFGLDADGVREEKIGDHRVLLCVDGPSLRFVNPAGRTLKSAPRAIRKTPELAELKDTLKELGRTLAAERHRLERALIEERVWRWHEVTTYLIDHPLTGRYVRNLIWQIPDGPAGLPARVGDGWELTDPHGHAVRPDPDTPVLLWHPIRATADEIRAWRDFLLDREVRQPFKQAFREVYPLTPAERETGTYSPRFSGHVLRYGQAKALLSRRGWTGPALGHRDHGGGEGAVVKALSGWQVRWGMRVPGAPEADGRGAAPLYVTGEMLFHRAGRIPAARDDRVPEDGGAVPLTEVPPLVFSEAMRDADLAVGVASIGLDQEALTGHEDYWREYGFGALSETAETRRDVLARLLPRLKIADRLELADRFLRVRGDLRTYKIHLGSGNVLIEPHDAHLCLVPERGRDAGQVFLPFEEDGGMLSIILSKALLLAGDTSITDPTITRRLR